MPTSRHSLSRRASFLPAGGATPGTPGNSGGGYSGVFQGGNPLLVAGGGGGGAFGSGPGHSGADGGAGGQVGAVVEALDQETLLVEFSDNEGRAYAIASCPRDDLLFLRTVPRAA